MEHTMDERGILRPWDIVERNPGVSPVCSVRGSSSSTQGSPLQVIHIQQELKGTLDQVVRHRVRVSQTHRPSLRFRGLLAGEHRREDRSLRTVGERQLVTACVGHWFIIRH